MATLLDSHGRPIKLDRKPILDVLAVATVRDKWSTYPSSGLTPAKLAAILREADAGDVWRQAELFEEMEEKDAHLFSLLQNRKNAVLGLDWEVLPFSSDRQDQKIAEFVNDVLQNLEGFEDNLLDLLDAIGKGFSVEEIIWQVEGKRVYPVALNWIHQKRFRFGDHDELRLITEDQIRGIELPPHKFVVHRYKARSGLASRAGVSRVLSWMYLFKNFGIKDWVRYAEVFGMPLRLGKYEAGASEDDKKALYQALVDLGSDAAGIISKATEIEFIEPKINTSRNTFQDLAEYIDRQMSKAVLGQTLTSEVGSSGSYAAAQVHNEVRQDLKEADCKALAETLRVCLIRPLVLFNFGPDHLRRLPWVKFHYEPPEDMKPAAEVYATLVGRVGLPISAEHVYERFGIPKPEPGDTILVPPTAAPMLPLKASAPAPSLPRGLAAILTDEPPSPDKAQRAVDAMAEVATQIGAPVIGETLEPLLQIVQEATSLEDMRARLIAAYENLETQQLEDLLFKAMYAAELLGRWSADG
ncbi:MAG: DUF935 domain-containing protein [Limnochordia bacterium]